MFLNSCAKYISNLSKFNTLRIEPNIFNNFNSFVTRHLFTPPILTNRKKEYTGRKIIGYSMEQMYDVVSDVEHYYQFVPFCKKSDILEKTPKYLKANLVIGFPPIVESYTSNVTLVKPYMVKAQCIDGKLFEHLDTIWKFKPALKSNPKSCVIDFYVSFEFRSLLHSQLAHIFFDKLVRQMEGAFISEARNRYGKATVPMQLLFNKKNS